MSRQLKFRAWFEGHMYEVAKLDFWGDPDQATCDLAGTGENGEWEELFDIYVGDVELMQYTGLKDKNGKEIFEGDVLNIYQYGHVVAEFAEGCYGAWDHYGFSPFRGTLFGCGGEVIGNIYENPELMA